MIWFRYTANADPVKEFIRYARCDSATKCDTGIQESSLVKGSARRYNSKVRKYGR